MQEKIEEATGVLKYSKARPTVDGGGIEQSPCVNDSCLELLEVR
jgi:hypothetical protein